MNETQTIKVFGDEYILRKTFDIVDYKRGISGFDVNDNNMNFLFHFDGEDNKLIVSEIRWRIYRSVL